ncbi:MAG: hypothetical protein WCD70_13770 [Alphaproteobacteria bacterium]
MLANSEISFGGMAARFGEIIAYGHLEQIERAAGICPKRMTGLDPETRLANAISAQDALPNPAAQAA